MWYKFTFAISLPWVPEVFLACGGNFRCWPKADTSSAVQKPETALEKSLAPREPFAINMTLNISFVTWIDQS